MNKKYLAVLSMFLVVVVSGAFYWGFFYGKHFRQAELALTLKTTQGPDNEGGLHVTVYIKRANESEFSFLSHHAGVLTTIGANWIEDQLGDSPSTDPAKWVSVSTDTGSPAAGWTQIPTEIAAGGLTRAVGTYASTGDGVWTITVTFTATSGHTDVQLTGLQYAVSGDNNLLAADTFTPVTLGVDDQLTVEWTDTVS